MGYLDNTAITVDAILTKKGRELLAGGRGEFVITKFALSDDEIDYNLWDTTHPDGTNSYGAVIENMPLLEAIPDEKQVMRYKLVTLPRTTAKLPIITLGSTAISLTRAAQTAIISPSTQNISSGDGTLGYTAILHNSDAGYLNVSTGGAVPSTAGVTTPIFLSDQETKDSTTVIGKEFTFIAKSTSVEIKTQITIIGNETGGTISIPVTVSANT